MLCISFAPKVTAEFTYGSLACRLFVMTTRKATLAGFRRAPLAYTSRDVMEAALHAGRRTRFMESSVPLRNGAPAKTSGNSTLH